MEILWKHSILCQREQKLLQNCNNCVSVSVYRANSKAIENVFFSWSNDNKEITHCLEFRAVNNIFLLKGHHVHVYM